MLEILRYGVILSFCITFVILCSSVIKTINFNKKKLYSQPQGDGLKGIFYALGKGLAPWEKESAVKHLPTYLAGILYLMGVFAALFYLLSLLILFQLGSLVIVIYRIFILIGILCGVGLFVKRLLKPHLKKISCPDDYASNLLVDGFLIISLIDTYQGNLKAILFAVAIIFGFFFGRRGVLPRKQWH